MGKSRGNISHTRAYQNGQSLIEIVVAIAVFMIGAALIGYLVIDSQVSLRQSIESTKASLLAREGLEAARAIRDYDFDNLEAGTHGITLTGGSKWTFSGTSDSDGKFVRSVAIDDIDLEVKKVVSTVVWNVTESRTVTTSLSSYLTDLEQSGGDAGSLTFNGLNAVLSASGTIFSNISIENIGTSTVTIDGMVIQWDGSETLQSVTVGGELVFSAATSSPPSSDSYIDIDDYSLFPSSGTTDIDALTFSGDMSGTDLVITLIVSDGSRKHALIDI